MPRQQTTFNSNLIGSSSLQSHTDYGRQLFDNELFSDCVIQSQQRKWHLHRAILAQRCEFFRACFSNNFQEASSRKGQALAEVRMHEDDPDAVGRMLRWLYTLEYPSSELAMPEKKNLEERALPSGFWMSELSLLVIADKYDLPALVQGAAHSIVQTATHFFRRFDVSTTSMADESVTGFVQMLETLYLETALVSQAIRQLQIDLMCNAALTIAGLVSHTTRLSTLLTTSPEFAQDLVEMLRKIANRSDFSDINCETNELSANQLKTSRSSVSSEQLTESWNDSRSDISNTSPNRQSRGSVRVKRHIPMNEDSDLD